MYARIINQNTKMCDVGIGSNISFYKSIGMKEMEVEQAYNGAWYVKGYAPTKPELTKAEKIAQLDVHYTSDKQDLMNYYMQALIADDADTMAEIKQELADLDAQYDNDMKELGE